MPINIDTLTESAGGSNVISIRQNDKHSHK
jgi:hypothetical protein